MEKNLKKITVVLFLVFIFLFFVLFFITSKRTFSETENRYLKQFPEVSVSSVFDGTFTSEYESYICDQFPLREKFVSIKTNTEILCANTDINGVYVGKNGYLLEKFDGYDSSLIEKQQNEIDAFATKFDIPVYFSIIPNSIYVNSDKLPAFAPCIDQNLFINDYYSNLKNVKSINILPHLKTFSDDELYYKTDHHWTTLGAFYAYEKLSDAMGIQPLKKSEFLITNATKDFFGTLYSKGNFPVKPDTIQCFKNSMSVNLEFDGGKTSTSFYFDEYLDKKDKYAYFFGGNPAYVQINGENRNGKTLVMLKDSYSHCLAPFFANSYQTIYMLDLRYINVNIEEYIKALAPTEILIIYNAKTLSEDRNILKL